MSLPYPIPANEARRLEILRECAILDTPPEQEYDDLLALAARICATPIAAITLVDEARQWFKARVGIDAPETSRDLSFCAHTICQSGGQPLIVDDASRDPRFATYANVACDPGLRFYAGIPLVTHDGAALGSLCIADRRVRSLPEKELAALRTLARHLVNTLELRRLVHHQTSIIDALEKTRRDLEQARAAAEQATAAKSRFLAAMSHEIRTPLNAIIGMTTLLADAKLDGSSRECADTIRSSGEILLTLVNDILDLSKIEAGRMTVESVETALPDLFAEVHRLMRPRTDAKSVRLDTAFDTPLPCRVLVDPTRLRQILLNLVGNATKFTDSGTITIRARIDAPLDADAPASRLVVDIADSGAGISPEQQARLFVSFSQADPSVTRRHGGSGLGLIICRRLAHLMGGNVSLLHSNPGEGSTFRVEVPIQPVPGTPLVSSLPHTTNLDDHHTADLRLTGRILYAEDGIDNQRLIALHLRRAGADLTLADNGRAALDAIAHAQSEGRPFQLLLTDMQMPEMDGYTLANTLRAQGCPIPIIALTAHAMAEDRTRCLAAGCDDYASKPIDKAALLRTCAAWLHRDTTRIAA